MALFFRWTLLYFIVATLLNALLRGDAIVSGLRLFTATGDAVSLIKNAAIVFFVMFFAAWRISPSPQEFLHRVLRAAIFLAICCVFLAAFSSVKTLMPLMAEAVGLDHFFADPVLAEVDRVLFFGTDPWRAAHWLTGYFQLSNFATQSVLIYGFAWSILGFYLPAIFVLFGADQRMLRHYLLLYFFSWVFLGNVVAFAGLSAGPVYFDLLFGTDRFAGLPEALSAGGLEDSWIGRVQQILWTFYSEGGQAVGSGIAAFPSVHVAMITVAALYMGEVWKPLASVGWFLVAAVLFISVWTGYHYLIDGYASIAAVILMHRVLKAQEHPNKHKKDTEANLGSAGVIPASASK